MVATYKVPVQRELRSGELKQLLGLGPSAAENRVLFFAAPVSLLLADVDYDHVLLANQRALQLFEIPSVHDLEAHISSYFADAQTFENIVRQTERSEYIEGLEAEMRTHSGRKFWADVSARRLMFEGKRAVLIAITDTTAHHVLEEKLRELATRDPLTLAFNRRYFLEICNSEIERSRRHAQPLSICMLDADHFKLVNDEYGHSVGDQVLQELCRACREDLRSSDVLSRVGGEEFVILFPNTPRSGAERVAERIRANIAARQLFTHDGRHVRFTVSGGVCELTSTDDLQNLLRRVDDAMYGAKRAGRNRIVAA
jgi:diguanylate cyclase (GGDEF)-like protein